MKWDIRWKSWGTFSLPNGGSRSNGGGEEHIVCIRNIDSCQCLASGFIFLASWWPKTEKSWREGEREHDHCTWLLCMTIKIPECPLIFKAESFEGWQSFTCWGLKLFSSYNMLRLHRFQSEKIILGCSVIIVQTLSLSLSLKCNDEDQLLQDILNMVNVLHQRSFVVFFLWTLLEPQKNVYFCLSLSTLSQHPD